MKKKINTPTLLVFSFLFGVNSIKGQESIPADTIANTVANFKIFSEFGISLNRTGVNTYYGHFATTNGQFDLKDNYLLTYDMNWNLGWLIKAKEDDMIWTLKTGINVIDRGANLTDSMGNKYRLSTGYFQIPVQFGARFPLRYNTVRNNLYRASEFNIGAYAATPTMQSLYNRDNFDIKREFSFANYVKFGIIGEVVFTALSKEGYGHKFGIRVSADLGVVKIKETKNQLYPYYYSVGLFYNIRNSYM